jgi:hypothetical protein
MCVRLVAKSSTALTNSSMKEFKLAPSVWLWNLRLVRLEARYVGTDLSRRRFGMTFADWRVEVVVITKKRLEDSSDLLR